MNALDRISDRHQRLDQLEHTIRQGIETFHAVGRALQDIRDGGLYRLAGYTSFDSYCRERWGFTRNYAWRLITAAGVVESLEGCQFGNVQSEAQARELAPLDPGQRLAVWLEATAETPAPTAARLAELTAKALGSLSPDEQREVIQGAEARVLAGGRVAAQVGGEGRAERLAALDRAVKKALRLAEGLGEEADDGLLLLGRARRWFQALPSA